MDESPQDRILEEFIKSVKSIFPDIPIVNWGYGVDFHFGFGMENYALRNSQYFTNTTNQSYFHLTSYRNLFSIINSGIVRLYNLTNSDDANELSSYKEVGLTQEQINYVKQSIFTFSFCKESDIENKQLWEDYGKVAIIFEILNNPTSWNYFHLSEVQYQTNPAFEKFYILKTEFEGRYQWSFRNETLKNLIAFHKIGDLNWEREVRLMCIPEPYGESRLNQYSDFKTSEHHTGDTKYIELGLYVEQSSHPFQNVYVKKLPTTFDEVYYADKPKIKIKAIKFGDNELLINQEKFNQLHFNIWSYMQERFGYKIEVDPKLFVTGVSHNPKFI
jgi:hypothetical protein